MENENIRDLGLKETKHTPKKFVSGDLIDRFTVEPGNSSTMEVFVSETEPRTEQFSQANISVMDIIQAIQRIKSNAIGTDGISPTFIKLILPYISDHICHIFKTILVHIPSRLEMRQSYTYFKN